MRKGPLAERRKEELAGVLGTESFKQGWRGDWGREEEELTKTKNTCKNHMEICYFVS